MAIKMCSPNYAGVVNVPDFLIDSWNQLTAQINAQLLIFFVLFIYNQID